jgi:hypothetical protein
MLASHPIVGVYGSVYMAVFGRVLVSLGFLAFLVSLVSALGIRSVFGLFLPERWLKGQEPAAARAS